MKTFLIIGCLLCPGIAFAATWFPIGSGKDEAFVISMEYESINIATDPPTIWLRKRFLTPQYFGAIRQPFFIDQSRFAFYCGNGTVREIARTLISDSGQIIWTTSIPARLPIAIPPGSLLESVGQFLCYLQKTRFEPPSLVEEDRWLEVKSRRPDAKTYISESTAKYRNGLVLYKSLTIIDPAPTKGVIPPSGSPSAQDVAVRKMITFSILDCKTSSSSGFFTFHFDKNDKRIRIMLRAPNAPQSILAENRDVFARMCSAVNGGTGNNQRTDRRGGQSDTASSTGTGFFINSDGYIATNHHVIEDCRNIRVRLSNRQITTASVIVSDAVNDVAIIKSAVSSGDYAKLRDTPARSGEGVVVIGFPLAGLLASEANVSTGIIAATAGMRNDQTNLQMSAAVQPGNSGGPLLDSAGYVLGVVVAKLNAIAVFKLSGFIPENINFAVKSDVLKLLLDANKIKYSSGSWGRTLDVPDNADRAKQFTVLIGCYR